MLIVACPWSYCSQLCWSSSSSSTGPRQTIAAAAPATCAAPRQTFASSGSCSRSVTSTKSHGCQLRDDGARLPASRMRSRSASAMGRSANTRTLRRARMASQVSMGLTIALACRYRGAHMAETERRSGPVNLIWVMPAEGVARETFDPRHRAVRGRLDRRDRAVAGATGARQRVRRARLDAEHQPHRHLRRRRSSATTRPQESISRSCPTRAPRPRRSSATARPTSASPTRPAWPSRAPRAPT